jgi:hypothetical protein
MKVGFKAEIETERLRDVFLRYRVVIYIPMNDGYSSPVFAGEWRGVSFGYPDDYEVKTAEDETLNNFARALKSVLQPEPQED